MFAGMFSFSTWILHPGWHLKEHSKEKNKRFMRFEETLRGNKRFMRFEGTLKGKQALQGLMEHSKENKHFRRFDGTLKGKQALQEV